jgi:hypothetical protein
MCAEKIYFKIIKAILLAVLKVILPAENLFGMRSETNKKITHQSLQNPLCCLRWSCLVFFFFPNIPDCHNFGNCFIRIARVIYRQ